MKITKLFIALIAISAVSLVGYSKYNTSDSSTLLMENVEALANDEWQYSNGQAIVISCGSCSANVIWCQGGGSGCTIRTCSQHG